MKKLMFLGLALGGVVLFSFNAFSRVCFLPGGSDDEFCLGSLPVYNSMRCPGYGQVCEHSKHGSKSCSDFGVDLFETPADCCESSSFYEVCPEDNICETGHECVSSDGFASCEIGHCSCPDYYRLCDGEGLIGIGQSCTDTEGTKYMDCECNRDQYYNCKSPATGAGQSCQDDGGTWYTECECPTSYDWVSDPDNCICGTKETCTSLPSGTNVYTCVPEPVFDCACGLVLNGGCPTGCTDSNFQYTDKVPVGITCQNSQKGLKGNTCHKDCAENKCEGFNLDKCPANGNCSECPKTNTTKYKLDSCEQGYTQNGNSCDVAQCPKNSATTVSDCGIQGDKGWDLGGGNGHYSAESECKVCTKKGCTKGDTSNTDVSMCDYSGTVGASKTANGAYSGDDPCYDCTCQAPASCQWTSINKGTNGSLSNQCCNGQYQTCTKNCTVVRVPANATGTGSCNGCGESGYTGWTCNSGYRINSDGTGCESDCGSGYIYYGGKCVRHDNRCWEVEVPSDSYAYCSSYCYWYGSRVCESWDCGSGYHVSGDGCEADCTCENNGMLSYKPSCLSDEKTTSSTICGTTCWSECECISPCQAVRQPLNAHGTTFVTACGKTCYTAWECNEGWIRVGDGCLAHDDGCEEMDPPDPRATCIKHCYYYGKRVCSLWGFTLHPAE